MIVSDLTCELTLNNNTSVAHHLFQQLVPQLTIHLCLLKLGHELLIRQILLCVVHALLMQTHNCYSTVRSLENYNWIWTFWIRPRKRNSL